MRFIKLVGMATATAVALGSIWMGCKLVQLCHEMAAEDADDWREIAEAMGRRDPKETTT